MEELKHGDLYKLKKTSSNYVIMKVLDPKNQKPKLINLLGVLFKG